ncbi:CpaF family protein [Frankia sp. CNm7]|uniref:CpaF family protein n=1 Tax=Frankia nepalensis TaxID=1836974 RepID=A0A937UPF4_9ACTN|nr:ATPase, T2SS/T4P/T4SS family [Frankia nepalensis]MBL7499867.1 CpaF family protein [Frankia nepalensis]MBL7512315.1 CpaF family protein [Frankia nepalensis]MBL7516961.1 CpaF family protein [Frankia nepalensis]MBL7629023.1 CpaF family protein [Frankia nepalensis]
MTRRAWVPNFPFEGVEVWAPDGYGNGQLCVDVADEAPSSAAGPAALADLPDQWRASALERLRVHLRGVLGVALAARPASGADDGFAPDGDIGRGRNWRQFAEAVLLDAADLHTQTALVDGAEVVGPDDEARVVTEVLGEVFGVDALKRLLRDPTVAVVNLNGDRVFVQRTDGRRDRLAPLVGRDDEVVGLVRDLAARAGVTGHRWDRDVPLVAFRLPDGGRLAAVRSVTTRPSVTIHCHRPRLLSLAGLRTEGMFDAGLEALLAALVAARKNIVVSGGPRVGKSALLAALVGLVPPVERLLVVEGADAFGLDIDDRVHLDVVTVRAMDVDDGAVGMDELVRAALRLCPDRLVVGEIRGSGAVPLLQAMSHGAAGSMTTMRAGDGSQVCARLAAWAAQGPDGLSALAANQLVANAVDVVVHLAEPHGRRGRGVVSAVYEVVDADSRRVVTADLYRPGHDRRAFRSGLPTAGLLDDLVGVGFDPRWLAWRE